MAVADPVLRRNVARAVDRFGAAHGAAYAAHPRPRRPPPRRPRRCAAPCSPTGPACSSGSPTTCVAAGGHVCWAPDADAANAYIAEVARRTGARTAVKSKSMATEETGLNDGAGRGGLRGDRDRPRRVDHPARRRAPEPHHRPGGPPQPRPDRRHASGPRPGWSTPAPSPRTLAAFARARAARAGSSRPTSASPAPTSASPRPAAIVLVTNEGNGRMVTSLPAGARRRDGRRAGRRDVGAGRPRARAARSKAATGQALTTYTSRHHRPAAARARSTGPTSSTSSSSTTGAPTSPATEFAEMLNCIRCGACLNVCPVYRQIGGHAYGWVYSGPDGRGAHAAAGGRRARTPRSWRTRRRCAGRAWRRARSRSRSRTCCWRCGARKAPRRAGGRAGGVEGVGGGVVAARRLPGERLAGDPRPGGSPRSRPGCRAASRWTAGRPLPEPGRPHVHRAVEGG